jgi:hypothetical protein
MDEEELLEGYVSGISGSISLDEDTAHWVALMLVAFRMDLYDRTISMAEKSLKSLQKVSSVPNQIATAICIIREEAVEKVSSQKTIRSSFDWDGHDSSRDELVARDYESAACSFRPEERDLLIISLTDDDIGAPEAYMRDNALVLLYAVAYAGSPSDAQALEEHLRDYLIQRLELYAEE